MFPAVHFCLFLRDEFYLTLVLTVKLKKSALDLIIKKI